MKDRRLRRRRRTRIEVFAPRSPCFGDVEAAVRARERCDVDHGVEVQRAVEVRKGAVARFVETERRGETIGVDDDDEQMLAPGEEALGGAEELPAGAEVDEPFARQARRRVPIVVAVACPIVATHEVEQTHVGTVARGCSTPRCALRGTLRVGARKRDAWRYRAGSNKPRSNALRPCVTQSAAISPITDAIL